MKHEKKGFVSHKENYIYKNMGYVLEIFYVVYTKTSLPLSLVLHSERFRSTYPRQCTLFLKLASCYWLSTQTIIVYILFPKYTLNLLKHSTPFGFAFLYFTKLSEVR